MIHRMKIKINLLIIFIFIFLSTHAEKTNITTHQINWKGIDVWSTNKSSKPVIFFEGARYTDNFLPYFVEIIDCENNDIFNTSIINPEYILAETTEVNLLKNESIPAEIEIQTSKLTEQGKMSLKIQILPFIQKNEKIYKLQKFDLKIEKIPTVSKILNATNHTYTSNSVLATGRFVKIKVSENGIYKLTYENLTSMGINPANVRVFGYGGAVLDQNFSTPKIDDLPEIAIYMNKGGDGVFNAGDYILFYAKGSVDWKYDGVRKMYTHTTNSYSKDGYYFVTSDAGVGKKITNTSITATEGAIIFNVNEFVDYKLHEKELTSVVRSGKVFYGEIFDDVINYNFPFSFPNIVQTASTKIRVDVMSASNSASNFTLKLNDQQAQTIPVPAITDLQYEFGKPSNMYFTFTPTTENLIANLSYTKPSNSTRGYLNYIEVNARRNLVMNGSVMFFRNIDNLSMTGSFNNFQLSGANENVQIWDITDPLNIKNLQITYSNGTVQFVDSADVMKQYVAINPTASSTFTQPSIGNVVPNQNLHAIGATDFLIITHPRFLTQANQLAEEHRTRDNLRVQVVTTDEIYNEFSSGTPDATAYRWILKMLYDRALASNITQDLPKYLLLFGRGSYDNRNLLTTSSESLVLSYQSDESLHYVSSYTSDDYFGLLDNSEGADVLNQKMDIGVGRFTVITEQQATDVVNKTINYIENKKKGIWKNQLCFVGDDGGGVTNDGNVHAFQADSVARMVYRNGKAFQLNKVYLDAYKQEINASGETYPLARARVQSLVNSGIFMLNFTGHAGPTGWTNEQILSSKDVKQFYNLKLPIWVAATCDFVAADANEISAGEYVLLNPTGGGIGIFAAARTVYSGSNFTLNKSFTGNLFKKTNGVYPRLGDVMKIAKNDLNGDLNRLSYSLLADPALKLSYPSQYNVVTDKINNNMVIGNDTLKALSVDSIQGHIEDFSGNIISDYNGEVEINIYDKNQKIKTLNNHNESNGVLTFDDRPNIIYSGKATVTNGKFSYSLMVPKDIRYNYGTGRINYYASELNSEREAQGFFENFIVGGASANYDKTDTIGPNVTMYLNLSTFKSGDKVNEAPLFVADISDKNGINTVGSGIGHDLRLVIDDDPITSYTVNEYFFATTNSYTSGSVQYKIPTLKEGKHTITFHAWDLLNNSTVSKIDFEVVNGLTPNIIGVSCYPNPANIKTNFVVIHDRPETVLETTVDIFDLVGRKIWTKSQSSTDNMEWDLTDFYGKKVQRGIYLFRVSIKTENSKITSKANKIIITTQQ